MHQQIFTKSCPSILLADNLLYLQAVGNGLLWVVSFVALHCVSKKCTNFETVLLKIIRINFNEIWQKYSRDSRIEFARFSFHTGLLLYELCVFKTGHRK